MFKFSKQKGECSKPIFQILVYYCKTPTLLNVIIVVFELIRGPMIERG